MDLEAAANPPGSPSCANALAADFNRRAPPSSRDTRTSRRDTGGLRTGGQRGGLAPWQLARVSRHIELHLSSKLTNSGLAALVRLHEDHFARAFKASLGRPPHAYVVARRIDQAKTLLLESQLTLCQIALATGFADQAHLTRRFRERVGDSPALWRRRYSRSGGRPWSH